MLSGLLAAIFLMVPSRAFITQTVCACFAFVSLSKCENLVLPMYY